MTFLRIVASLTLATAVFGQTQSNQMRDNQEKQLKCDNGYDSRARHCDIREQSAAALGLLDVDAGRNGGATVKGWSRSDVLVRTRVEGWGDTESEAQSMASQVSIDTSGGHVRAQGPQSVNHAGWSVSFEIFVPQATSLTVKTGNGGITVSDIRGNLKFEATNGGIQLKRLAGEVNGSTVNGGVNVELMGATWEGNQVQISTRNGGVTLSVPENYSAHFQTETQNGSLRSEFPLNIQEDRQSRSHDFTTGGGGPVIHVKTTNGGVTLKRT
jgi:DUF4097 and DUF4098 domain-containing protein YvlB